MRRYLNWKTGLIITALAVVSVILFKFNQMAKEMAAVEKGKVETLITGFKSIMLSNPSSTDADVTFASKVVANNKSIPLILTDENGNIIDHINIDTARIARDTDYLSNQLAEFKRQHQPLVINYQYGENYVYYGDSKLLTQLRYYPIFLVAIVFLFLLIVFVAYYSAQRSIQNQVWVGMAKETAHQMGTPLSSIVGWMELLKDNEANRESIEEMEKDVNRLQLVADRFSKIGAVPQLDEENLITHLEDMVAYMSRRAPQRVSITFDYEADSDEVCILLNGPLFDWVIENLMRNALDAMEGEGHIHVHLKNESRIITIDLSDTGKGIARKNYKKVFMPGFSTKKRGWGLGLSLAKRIIEKYHNGSIFVRHSAPGKGTTFRIILRR